MNGSDHAIKRRAWAEAPHAKRSISFWPGGSSSRIVIRVGFRWFKLYERAANICYSLSQSTTTRMNRVRQAFEPSIRRAFHLYWRWARGMTLGVRGLVTDKDQRNLCPRLAIAGWRGGTRRDGGRGSGSRTRGGGQYRNPGLFFNSRVSQRDHVALFIVRSFRQQRVPVPNREITAHGSFSLDALPENTTPGTRARIAEVILGAPLSERL
jgi:hypothetical protein